MVASTLLNVCAGPGTGHAVLAALAVHSCADLLQLKDNWYKVQLASAQTGWCSADYIDLVAACPEATATAAAADTVSAEPAATAPAASPASMSSRWNL